MIRSKKVFVRENHLEDTLAYLDLGQSAMITCFVDKTRWGLGYIVEFDNPQIFDEFTVPTDKEVIDLE